ncbi:cell division protein FtsI/penicillin-binding protein 2 [Natronobacillus azotifigens]|uniref:serine-type D-Ala-D-Ala carboxypeptidase n=1 Tax=Natronobacillus azotifigens TaxID=472978 RepID=A0A9J6RF74_9BACI|nr:penicillin-binding protein 2 [Natronobacillus azotifigens]MCZ0704054.1 penicillin-binding protein 2 [Natronobacillus azotifigens]
MGKTKKKAQLPFRLNLLFVFIFFLFSLLILQLGVVQILNGEEARNTINETENIRARMSVPRGLMYDRFGNLVLDNEPERTITYTPPRNGDSAKKRLEIAEKLAEFIMMEEEFEDLEARVRERDKQEYWYLFNTQEAGSRLTEEEKELSAGEQYNKMLEKIKPEDYNTFDWSDRHLLNVVAIKKELDTAFQLSPHTIKNENVTEEEYALVSENLAQLPGIDATIDWNRVSKYDNTFSSFIGRISSSNEGIPRENRDYYLSLGYSRNDRVGTSGLEQQYENMLRGQKEVIQYTTNSNGTIIGTETIVDGKAGNDLILTVDMELQQRVDEIAKIELENFINQNPRENEYMSEALVAMLDPQTGEVLALSGAHYDRENDRYVDHSYRVVYDAHLPGSSIKGATMLAGYDANVIEPGEIIYDRPIRIAETQPKSSWTDLGRINDLTAIEQSSNVYMFEIAMRLATATYRENEPLYNFDRDAFRVLRNYFSQFGLGARTGIDLPFEATGVIGTNTQDGGLLLDTAIGQHDAYTTLQLAQYVSTIANDGYRVRPHLVKEVRQANGSKESLGPIVESHGRDILNRIDMDESYIKRVQEGFRLVTTDGTARGHWANSPYNVALKTGTAQNDVYEDGEFQMRTNNLTLVGYAPYDEPEVAFAIVVPRAGTGNDHNGIHHRIGNQIMEAYFDLKEERDQAGITENLHEQIGNEAIDSEETSDEDQEN